MILLSGTVADQLLEGAEHGLDARAQLAQERRRLARGERVVEQGREARPAGEDAPVDLGKVQLLVAALVGLVVIVLAQTIITFVVKRL